LASAAFYPWAVARLAEDENDRFSWTGSLTTCVARYKAPLEQLLDHPVAEVRHWTRGTVHWLDQEINKARIDADEFKAHLEM